MVKKLQESLPALALCKQSLNEQVRQCTRSTALGRRSNSIKQGFLSFFKKFIYLFIYLWLSWVFVAAHGLFSSCGEWGLLLVAVRGLLIAVASLVAEHRLQACGLQYLWLTGSGVQAQ